MRRVASLYLPNLPTDRIRRNGGSGRHKEGRSLRSPAVAGLSAPEEDRIGSRIEDCSCPRGGGWRPGARWARREEIQAEIEELPLHQRPLMRELGRRTDPAEVPFRRNAVDRRRGTAGRAIGSGTDTVLPPLVLVRRSGSRIEIAAACPVAQRLGLVSGMPLTQARAMVPGLDIRDSEPDADAALLIRLALFAARRWTPIAAISDPQGLWLDLTGVGHLFGGERRMCARILRFCGRLGLAARVAVAGTPGAAHALARHSADPITLCPAGTEAEAVAGLPISALRIDEETEIAALRLGIDRIGDLAAMPRGPLQRRFGGTLLTRLDQALGLAGEPFDPIVPQDPPAVSLRFAEPIASAEAIEEALSHLMDLFVSALEHRGLAARRTGLVCSRIDGLDQRLVIGTARATRDGTHLLRLLKMQIETIEPGFGIESMQIVGERCEPLAPIPIESLLSGEAPSPDLVPLIDRLAGRLGARRLFRSSAVESDVPERSVARLPPLAPTTDWPQWPRPVRLFSRPERIDKVLAELPDQPPVRFSWRGRMHRVRRADGPERIYGEWWKRSGEADAVRDYFQVEVEDGARFWLYRRGDGQDSRTGDLSWWLQGVFG